jgi:hypothetical protein
MKTGDIVSIVACAALSSTLCVAASSCEAVQVTEKAVLLKSKTNSGKEITAWFPIRALSRIGNGDNNHHTVKLAKWFKPSDWVARFLQLTTTLS